MLIFKLEVLRLFYKVGKERLFYLTCFIFNFNDYTVKLFYNWWSAYFMLINLNINLFEDYKFLLKLSYEIDLRIFSAVEVN